ncbi:hypothetical protein Q3G72_016304 [Acer saccharum]|nr:hypothetical protein Q3G72_016304 [Acer saccharum]
MFKMIGKNIRLLYVHKLQFEVLKRASYSRTYLACAVSLVRRSSSSAHPPASRLRNSSSDACIPSFFLQRPSSARVGFPSCSLFRPLITTTGRSSSDARPLRVLRHRFSAFHLQVNLLPAEKW